MPKYKDVDKTGLREADKLIIFEYLQNGFKKAASYFKYHPEISPKSANNLSAKFFNREEVKKLISEFIKKVAERKEITATKTIHEISEVAYGKAKDDLTHEVKRKSLRDLAEIQKLLDPEAPPPNPDNEDEDESIQIILPDNRRCAYVIKTK
jgi:hypothetical protein